MSMELSNFAAWMMHTGLVIASIVGMTLSGALTVDSLIRYIRVRRVLDGNYFPLMHLRVDFTFFAIHCLGGFIAWSWLSRINNGNTDVIASIDDLSGTIYARMVIISLMIVVQLWNAWDRTVMHFGNNRVEANRREDRRLPIKANDLD